MIPMADEGRGWPGNCRRAEGGAHAWSTRPPPARQTPPRRPRPPPARPPPPALARPPPPPRMCAAATASLRAAGRRPCSRS
jgi:hypothetical protein